MSEDKDDLGQLLRAAGRRPEPSPAALTRMRSHAHAQWQAGLAARRRQRWFAVAASVLVLVGGSLFFMSTRQTVQTQITARIASGAGAVQVDRRGLAFMTETDPDLTGVGDRVSTGASRGALLAQLPSGTTTLRLDRNTSVEWVSHDHLRLLSGRLYVDTGRNHGESANIATDPLVIEAGDARIQHTGTQFIAALESGQVQVGVRDGTVQVAIGNDSARLRRGESATVKLQSATGSANPITLGRLGASGEAWRWADELAPRLPIEGHNLVAVLRTLAYQAGLELSFATQSVEADALATTLHGPVLDMAPQDALRAILATSSFRSLPAPGDDSDALVIDTR